MKTILVLLLLAAPCSAQCYSPGHAAAPCYRPAYNFYTPAAYAPQSVYAFPIYTPYIDQRFQVTYDLQFPPLAATGATVYGYGAPAVAGLDPAGYLNAAGRYASLGGELAATGAANYSQAAHAQQQATEMAIRSQLVRAIMAAPAGSITGGSGSLQYGRGANGQMEVEPGAAQPGGAAAASGAPTPPADSGSSPSDPAPPTSLQGVADKKCIECHGASRKERGLDLRNLQGLTSDQVRKVLTKIMADNPSERMPPASAKGGPLTTDEKIAFVAGGIQAAPEKTGQKDKSPDNEKVPLRSPASGPPEPPVIPKKQ